MTAKPALSTTIPPRRYLNREEAAAWLGVGVDTFMGFDIPYCDFGPRCKRWDIVDIVAYAEQNKRCDSARISATQKGRQTCESTSETTHRNGGFRGTTRTESDIAEVLELKTVG